MNIKKITVLFLTVFILFTLLGTLISGEEYTLSIEAQNAIIINMDTDTILFEQNADELVFCGFLPRLMTCIMLVESGLDLDGVITVDKTVRQYTPQISAANISGGDKISLGDLMNAVLVCNSQEAAVAIALCLSGGKLYSFLDMMDSRAKELGAENTHFANVTGYYDSSSVSYTTARDTLKIVCHALELDYILERSNARYAALTVNGRERKVYTKNSLIDSGSEYYYKKASGLALHGDNKIGSSMASMIEDKSIRFVSVVISSYSIVQTYADITNMLYFSLNEYQYYTLIQKNYPIKEVKVKLGKDRDYVVLSTDGEVSVSMPKSADKSGISNVIDAPEVLTAPIEKGTIFGSLTVLKDGEEIGKVNLVAQSDVELDMVSLYTSYIGDFFANKYLWATIVTLLLLIVFYIILTQMLNSKKKRKHQAESRERIHFR